MHSPSDAFTKTLETLNPEQRQAVEGIHGPWMVLAGPGTGKTHMLAARIGNILLNEQIEPGNILCLTFTNAGVKAMRDRLIRFMGAPGSRVAVHTFHDFARRVIDENPHLFDYRSWEPMDALDQHRLINKVIDGLPPKHLMRGPLNEPYTRAKSLLWLFSLMDQERWTPEEVIAAADRHIEEAPTLFVYKRKYKEFQKGDPNPKKVAEEVERMNRLKAAVSLYEPYASAKRAANLYDYGDQLAWMYQALAKDELLRLQLQEQYQYILVDEYQDTNGLQNDILALIAEDDNPNLFVVGDDDQSIFEFQGARIESLRELVERYRKDLHLAVLRSNYRSHQAILDAAETSISPNQNRLIEVGGQRLEKHLREGGSFAERPRPKVINYPTELAQAFGAVTQIKDWLASGTPADEIGVIYRNHRQGARLIDMLEREKVPYRLQRSINVLELPLIIRLHQSLSFIGNLKADLPVTSQQVFEFFNNPAIGINAVELAEINDYRFTQSRRVPSWRYLLAHPERLTGDDIPISNPQRFQVAADLLNELATLVDRVSLPTMIQQTVQRTGLLREALASDERALHLEALDQLVRDAQARLRKDSSLNLAQLCATWDEMNAYDLPLSLTKQADTRAAVSLMTAHSAKGLEFDCVILYDVTKRAWDSNRNSSNRFALPPVLSHQTDFDKEEANRRLFYVALTRARKEAIFTVPEEGDSGRAVEKSQFLQHLLTEGMIEEQDAASDDEALLDSLEDFFKQEVAIHAPTVKVASAKTQWEEQDLTLGAATQFERCRLGFYYQYVSGVPKTPRSLDRYRNAMHETLRAFYRQAMSPEQLAFGAEEELIALWHHELSRERPGLKANEYSGFLAEGEEALRAWYNSADDPLSLNVVIERSISLTTAMDLPLRGRIDRIDIDPQTQIGIPVDYKFGEAQTIKVGLDKKTQRLKQLDDRNWRQLAFYAILMRDGFNKGVLPKRGKLVYLSPRGTQVVEVPLDPEEVKLFEDELYDTYHAIRDADHFTGCHELPETSDRDKMNCAWCSFHYLKRNDAQLVSEEVASLDDEG